MDRRPLILGATCLVLVAACSTPQRSAAPQPPQAAAPQSAPAPRLVPPLTLDGYKKAFAEQVARSSPDLYTDPNPEVLKSIVVLDITIDRDGRLAHVSVRRSNGYKALEKRAMDNVRRAAPYGAPAFTIRRSDGSVNFLETFLFRDDGRFKILSLQQG
jgi:periplasmic protein TonB